MNVFCAFFVLNKLVRIDKENADDNSNIEESSNSSCSEEESDSNSSYENVIVSIV